MSHTLPLSSLLIVPHLLQPGVLVSDAHINCGNESHPEEQLESSSVSTTDFVGKLQPGGNLTEPQKNTICSSPTSSHLSQRATLTKSITDHTSMELYMRFGDRLVPPKSYFALPYLLLCWP